MTCSTSYCLSDKNMDLRNVNMYVCMYVRRYVRVCMYANKAIRRIQVYTVKLQAEVG